MTEATPDVPTPPEETVLTAPVPEPGPDSGPEPVPEPAPEPAPDAESVPEPAPEPEIAYGDFTLPEGATLDAAALEQATALFREARLPQEQAQKFVDLALAREKAALARGAQAFADLQTGWVAAIKADPEIGGPRFAASIAAAGRVLDRLAVPGLREALNLTGAGNNPAIVKAFVRLAGLIAEDRFHPARNAPPPRRTPAETIYDGSPKQSL